MIYGISILIGYLVGNFQTSYILGGKTVKKLDIREHGSGNSGGATNAVRVMGGWKLGLIAFVGDILKAVLAVVILRIYFDDSLAGLYAGIGVVVGHNWPVVLGFKGGKGIASTLGLLLAYDIRIGLVAWAISAAVIIKTKYVSLGSIILVSLMPIGIAIVYPGRYQELILTVALAIVAIYRHKANIGRLIRGEENKLGRSKKPVDEV